MPIERPSTSTILRSPGGISSARATTCFTRTRPRSETVELASVVEPDPLLDLFRQLTRQHHVGVVAVPVRIVAREHEVIAQVAVVLEQLEELLGPVGLLDRLRREPQPLAHDL